MRQTELALSDADRKEIQRIVSKGALHARCFKRAQILSCLDRGVQESSIADVLEIGRSTIWRTRKEYLEGGLAKALHDERRSGRPRRFDDGVISEIVALTRSDPPPGAKRWTVRSLTDEAMKRLNIGSISRETIRLALKTAP